MPRPLSPEPMEENSTSRPHFSPGGVAWAGKAFVFGILQRFLGEPSGYRLRWARPALPETKEKELSTKGHEERRRATKALRLAATGYQGHERIIDFQLFHSRMIRTVVGGGGRTCLKQNLFHSRMIRPVVGGGGPTCLKQQKKDKRKRVIHEGPRRTDEGPLRR